MLTAWKWGPMGPFGEFTGMRLFAVILAILLAGAPVHAEERVTLGWGRLFTNDALGDGRDRWRTGSYTLSRVRGASWSGSLPDRAGDILEFRFRGEIIAPESLTTAAPGDRRYAGALSFGLHTHFMLGRAEASVGGDLVFLGPQTGLGAFQRAAHDLFGIEEPLVLDDQIANRLAPTVTGEIARSFRIGSNVTVRPFLEAQAGVESLVRAGGDIVLGAAWDGALMLRDPVTGQRYAGVKSLAQGVSFTFGADIARVFDSDYLPSGGAAELSDERTRVRAGVEWQGERAGVFYGLTYLGPEFDGQPDGQVTGSLRVNFDF
jgi:Uncharacterized protein conserved in bacteria (DUF2219)